MVWVIRPDVASFEDVEIYPEDKEVRAWRGASVGYVVYIGVTPIGLAVYLNGADAPTFAIEGVDEGSVKTVEKAAAVLERAFPYQLKFQNLAREDQ